MAEVEVEARTIIIRATTTRVITIIRAISIIRVIITKITTTIRATISIRGTRICHSKYRTKGTITEMVRFRCTMVIIMVRTGGPGGLSVLLALALVAVRMAIGSRNAHSREISKGSEAAA